MRIRDLIKDLKLIEGNPKVKDYTIDLKFKKKRWIKPIGSDIPMEGIVVLGVLEGGSMYSATGNFYAPRIFMTYIKNGVWHNLSSLAPIGKPPEYWCHLNLPKDLNLPKNWPEGD